MARTFNGSTQYATRAGTYLSSSTGPFTLSLRFTPANLTDTVKAVLANGTGAGAYWQLRLDAGVVVFESAGYTGSNPGTGSGITWSTATMKHAAWRYRGQANEWSKWDSGTKTVISSAISFTLPSVGSQFDLARNWSGAYCAGTYAEVAIWQAALSDEQMAELAAGVAPDVVAPGGLLAYWPLRGNTSPEPNYVLPVGALTLANSPSQGTHPTVVAPTLANVVRPVWIVDILHDTTPIRAATTDCDTDHDTDTLGGFYRSHLASDLTIAEALPDVGSGIILPTVTALTVQNTSGTISRTQEWRQTPVKVRYYDQASHALLTAFTGVVADVQIANNRAVFRCTSLDSITLDQLVPRAVIEVAGSSGLIDDTNGTTRRADLNLPIPYVFGTALVNPPFVAEDTTSTLGGGDFVIHWTTAATVEAVWFDYDANTPGLEPANTWDTTIASNFGPFTAVGTATFGMPTGSTATAAVQFWAGRPVRYTSATAGTVYSHIASISGTVTTVADGILPAAPATFGTIDLGNDYSVDNARYKYVYSGGSTWLKTLRMLVVDAAPIVQVCDPTNANPANAIKFILNDAQIGLGGSVDATAFATAATAFAAAGLGTAVAGALGGDRAQRRAGDVINELALFRGARIWKDADTEAWTINVDSEPAAPTLTFEYGPDTRGNITEVVSISRTPLDQAISSLKMRYAPGGRARRNAPLEFLDYGYTAATTVLAVGGERVIYQPWIRSHEVAARVLYYLGKRLARSDERIVFRTGPEGRRVSVGDVVAIVIDLDGDQISGNYRIVAREWSLTQLTFTAVGPYLNDIYTTTWATIAAAVSLPSGDANPDEREGAKAADANLYVNPDFGTKTTKATPFDTAATAFNDGRYIPGWVFSGGTATFATISVTPSIYAKGGHYLTTTLTGGTIYIYNNQVGNYNVLSDTTYITSIYTDTHPARWLWRMFIDEVYDPTNGYSTSLSTVTVPARLVPGDTNTFGWKRYYGVFRTPSSTAQLQLTPAIVPSTGGSTVTMKWDAAQLEQQTRLSLRPTPWHRNVSYGIVPEQLVEGDVTVRPVAYTQTTEHGSKLSATTVTGSTGVAMSGATVTLGTAPAGLISAVTARVKAGITFGGGGASWRIGTSSDPTMFGTALGTASGGTVSDAQQRISWVRFGTATPIIATPNTGTFAGGTVVATIHALTHPAPTG